MPRKYSLGLLQGLHRIKHSISVHSQGYIQELSAVLTRTNL